MSSATDTSVLTLTRGTGGSNYNLLSHESAESTNTLPFELIEKIFSWLSIASLRVGCLTCRKWEFVLKLKNNPCLWKQLVFQPDGCSPKLWSQYLGEISAIEQDNKMLDPALRLKEMGFIGLSNRGNDIIRTIVTERCSPLKEGIKKCTIQINNGLLLSGPPGTGKTLLVGSLSSLLNCESKNIQLLSGQTIYDEWKERSVADVGKIFAKTIEDAQASTNQNETFLLVIDKIDAIFSRCSNESNDSWMHSVSSEFIAQMHALKNVYNILVIGMTNYLEKIDEALTRPENFGELIELATPDLQGRKEFLHIRIRPMIEQGLLATDVNFNFLAQLTEGLTCFEINESVRQAMGSALKRMMSHQPQIEGDTLVTMGDLCVAFNEAKLA